MSAARLAAVAPSPLAERRTGPSRRATAARRAATTRRAVAVGALLAAVLWAPARAVVPPAAPPASWMFAWQEGPLSNSFAPSVWVNGRGVGVSLGGSYAVGLSGGRDDRGAFEGSALELGVGGERAMGDGSRSFGSISSRFHVARAASGAWLAASAVSRDDGGNDPLPFAGAGAWMERGRVVVAWQIVQLLRPVPVARRIVVSPDTSLVTRADLQFTQVTDFRYLSGAESSVGWSTGRLQLESRAGIAVGLRVPPARWGELRAALWTRPGLALFGRVGTATNVARVIQGPRGTDAALGLQLAPGRGPVPRSPGRAASRPAPRLEALGDGVYRLVLESSARDIEVQSDATEWRPVAARAVAPGQWEVRLTLSPGVHRILMRSGSGAWRPVPGLPSGADEFGGRVSLIAVD